jgi:hypothetical protein
MQNSLNISTADLDAGYPDDYQRVEVDLGGHTPEHVGLQRELIVLDNAVKGLVLATINNLPSGTTVFLASANEINIHDGTPHRGAAAIDTLGVNLHANDRKALIRFRVRWSQPLKCGIMTIYG